MAGSNGSPAQRGGHPPQWPTESDEQAHALELERWQQQQAQQRGYHQPHPSAPPHSGYAPPSGYGQPSHVDPAYPAHGYNQPHQPDFQAPPPHGSYDPNGYAEAPGGPRPQPQFAPQFERFAPHQQEHPGQPLHHDPRAPFDQHGYPAGTPEPLPPPQLHDPFDPHRGQPQYDPRQGYTPPPAPQYHGHQDARGDLQSWDLSHYQPSQIPPGYAGQPPPANPHAHPEWPQQHAGHEPSWQQQPQPGHGHWQHPDHGHAPQSYEGGPHGQYPQHQLDAGYDPRAHHDPGYDAEEMAAPEETRRGPSTVLVVGMLVGAIVVGGGLAFAYKQFGGGGKPSAKVAEIKRQSTPEKVRPQDPGGKTIEHSDKKFLNRLAAEGPATEQHRSDIEGAAKKVSTIPIVVNRDGSLTPQASISAPEAPGSGVPGLVIDGLGPPPVPASQPPLLRGNTGPEPSATRASRLPPPPPPPAAQPLPRVADLPLPKVTSSPPPVTAAVGRTAPTRPERDDFLSQRASAGATGASGLGSPSAPPRKPVASASASGYVAVLASKRSRQDALNAFADLHSQYPDILGGITPDVREANLGDKGVWYRLIGGPPGSREAARGICVKLKAKGMKDCWPVAY